MPTSIHGTLPNIADTTRFGFDLLWRAIDRLRISNAFFQPNLESESAGGDLFTNKIFRSYWNYQLTAERSVHFIAQYDGTDAGAALPTRIVPSATDLSNWFWPSGKSRNSGVRWHRLRDAFILFSHPAIGINE